VGIGRRGGDGALPGEDEKNWSHYRRREKGRGLKKSEGAPAAGEEFGTDKKGKAPAAEVIGLSERKGKLMVSKTKAELLLKTERKRSL